MTSFGCIRIKIHLDVPLAKPCKKSLADIVDVSLESFLIDIEIIQNVLAYVRQPSCIHFAYIIDQVVALFVNTSNKLFSKIISHSRELNFVVYMSIILSCCKYWNCLFIF